MLPSMRFRCIASGFLLLLLSQTTAFAQAQKSFSDVSSNHPAYEAVEYLKSKGIIGGYPDGTFKPEKKVNRAEAVTIIAAPRITPEALTELIKGTIGFDDVPQDAWYKPYLIAAVSAFGFIDGPEKRPSFEGVRPVLKAEFLKMLLVANDVDVTVFSEIQQPLALDVQNPNEWYYPHFRTAIAYSMTMADAEDLLSPGRELTRGEVVLLMHRFLMFQEKRRTQALLSEAESEIARVLDALGQNSVAAARRASTRSVLAARGAYMIRPNSDVVKAAVKVAEAFQELVLGYEAGISREFDKTIKHAQNAWGLADEAEKLSPELGPIIDQLRQTSSRMADDARGLRDGGG